MMGYFKFCCTKRNRMLNDLAVNAPLKPNIEISKLTTYEQNFKNITEQDIYLLILYFIKLYCVVLLNSQWILSHNIFVALLAISDESISRSEFWSTISNWNSVVAWISQLCCDCWSIYFAFETCIENTFTAIIYHTGPIVWGISSLNGWQDLKGLKVSLCTELSQLWLWMILMLAHIDG